MRKHARLLLIPCLILFALSNGFLLGSDKYFSDLASLLRHSYIDQNVFKDVKPMLREGLRALENAEDGIMVEESYDSAGTTYRVNLEGRSLKISEREVDSLEGLGLVLNRVMKFIGRYFKDGEEKLERLKYAMANGLVSVLDPHTNVFSPKEYKEFFVHIEGEICGIGAYIGVRDGKLRIISPLDGTPAKAAGLKAKDHVVRVNDESTVSMTTQEAVSKIRGKENSEVVLWIKRKGLSKVLKVPIIRKKVTIPSVKSQLLADDIAYIKVINFAHTTALSFQQNLSKLKTSAKGKLKGLVLDLRDNPGGLLDQAVYLADSLLKKGDIVLTAHKNQVRRLSQAKNHGLEPECPIIVLINQGSASGSEILAGALRNNDRGVLLGRRTFGKGSVQQLRDLEDESYLKLTVYEYLLANQMSIQNVGVPPDIELAPAVLESDEIRVFAKGRSMTERLHDNALVSRFVKDEEPRYRMISYFDLPDDPADGYDIAESFVKGEFDLDGPQFVAVQLACKLIKLANGSGTFQRQAFLTKHKKDIQDLKAREFNKVIKQMKKFDIDWRNGPMPAKPDLALTLSTKIVVEPPDAKKNGGQDEDDPDDLYEEDPTPVRKVAITAVLKNNGDKPVYRVEGVVESDDIVSIFSDKEFLFGHVPPGKSVSRTVKITIPYFSIPREEMVSVALRDQAKKTLDRKSLTIQVPSMGMPRMAITAKVTDDKGREVAKLAPNGSYRMTINVRNVGDVPVYQGVVRLKNETDPSQLVDLIKGRATFTGLKPGQNARQEFSFDIKGDEHPASYQFRLDAYETSSLQGVSKEFDIPGSKGGPFKDLVLNPPAVTSRVSSLLTSKEYIDVRAVVEDDHQLRHFMVLSVSRDKGHIDSYLDKVFFRAFDAKGPETIATRVKLKPGRNLVNVVVTDDQDLKTIRSYLVWRK